MTPANIMQQNLGFGSMGSPPPVTGTPAPPMQLPQAQPPTPQTLATQALLQQHLAQSNQALGMPAGGQQQAFAPPPMPQAAPPPAAPQGPNYHIPGSLNQNQSQMMQALLSQAQQTFPNNPTMQKVAVTMASRNAGLFNGGDPDQMRQSGLFGMGQDGPNPGSPVMMRQNNTGPGIDPRTGQYNAAGGMGSMNIGNAFTNYSNMLQGRRYQGAMNAQTPQAAFDAMGIHGGGPQNNINSYYQNNIAPIYG